MLGLTVQQVADACGVSKSTVSRWENGIIKNMRRNSVMRLAYILGISPFELLGEDDGKLDELCYAYKRLNKEQQKKVIRYMEKLSKR